VWPDPPADRAAPPRIELIDALRGFALLGIIVVNVTFFASAFKLTGLADPNYSDAISDVTRWLFTIVFETKFYLLFSLLFGYSFTIQLESARRREVSFRSRFLRRLLGLAVLGVAHAILLFQRPGAMAMFLIGLAAGKVRALHNPERFAQPWRPMLLIGLAVGIPGGLLYAWGTVEAAMNDPARQILTTAADVPLAPFLTAAYVAAFALSTRTGAGLRLQGALAPAGRMALTNYLMQSLVLAFVFTGYGAGLIGKVAPLGAVGIAIGIFLLQLPLSAWWLSRYRYGPLEWLLRAFTNLEWPGWQAACIDRLPSWSASLRRQWRSQGRCFLSRASRLAKPAPRPEALRSASNRRSRMSSGNRMWRLPATMRKGEPAV
jgi:uncharacterized membrane protein YeiB